MRSLFLDALAGKNHSGRPPVWLMRQAGRYQQRYRLLREKHRLLDLFRSPERIFEVTLLPIEEFAPDAAILFSDILIVFDAMGIQWDVKPGVGPVVAQPIRTLNALEIRPAEETLHYVYDGIRLLRQQLTVPLIGFCGGPFTVASYAVEGSSSKSLRHSKRWLFADPDGFDALLERFTDCLIDHLRCQVAAGVQALQLFDTWAGQLAPQQFDHYCQTHLIRIVAACQELNVPLILFCRGGTAYVQRLGALKPAGLACDWTVDMPQLRETLGSRVALQGNLDPTILFAGRQAVTRATRSLLAQMGDDPAFILNLGHGVLPETPPEAVHHLISAVREHG